MFGRITFASAAVALALATGVAAQPSTPPQDRMGRIERVDQSQRIVVFSDGRMYRWTPNTVVLIDSRPVAFETLQPGSTVIVRAAEPVMLQGNEYVVVGGANAASAPVSVRPYTVVGPSASVIYPPASVTTAPPAVAMTPGASTTVVAPGATVTTTTQSPVFFTHTAGTVTRVDRVNNVIVLDSGRMVQLAPQSVVSVNGQQVTITQITPGTVVAVDNVNPVVYRDGRYVVLNQGYIDSGNAGSMTWDAKYAGYEADASNAGMQVQSGGN